ncbi:MAG: DNA polymerase III subunit delta [Phenylobacterium sp.]|uniref:DNA polymerase III subunit delta n=1 Tax=Phenylobacterium sp. TaxID=1871053 RepID=UPI002733755E|nr:DNA polymerase III subunit delta [Phenylobacterium sp.]MDP1641890.1 DNA polymerase III subunit delta [Phenylobacterium sp.]MDP3118190.1 DNA polymerase III subunit delta [Phenylobacterium sp.]
MILSRRPDIERFLARPDPGIRGALIYGRDIGVVRERANQLAAKAVANPDDPFDVALLTDGDIDGDAGRLDNELASQSLMGGRRLVRLKLSSEKASLDKMTAEAVKGHDEGAFNPEAFFLIEAGNLGRDSTLRKIAEKAAGIAVIPCYEDEPGDMARLVREALNAEGVGLNADALGLFVARLPKDRGVARQEIERLILYLGPRSGITAGPKDLEDFLGVEPEASLADAASDAFGGRIAEAQSGLRRAAAEGEAGPAAVRAISQHLAKLRRTLTLVKSGAGLPEAAKASGVFWKNEREFLRQARAWSLETLDAVQPEVLAADRACKTTGSPDRLIAERLALTIAARARRMGL